MRLIPSDPQMRLAAIEQWLRQDEVDIINLWRRIQDVAGGMSWPGNPIDLGVALGGGGLVTYVRTLEPMGAGFGHEVQAIPQTVAGGGFSDDTDAAEVTVNLGLGAGFYLEGLLQVSIRRDATGIFADPLQSGLWFVRAGADEDVAADGYSTATLYDPLDSVTVNYQALAGAVTSGDGLFLAWDVYQGIWITFSSGGGDCPAQNEIQRLIVTGSPSGGSTIFYPSGMTADPIDYDSDNTAATTAFETAVGSGNVSVTGGPWPDVPLDVEFIGDLANTPIPAMSFNKSGMVGTGVGIIVQTIQQGRS